jgi:hypothetical protein
MSAQRRSPGTRWRRAVYAAWARLRARPRTSESRRAQGGATIISIAYLRRAQIAGRELGATQLAVLVHLAAGGRPDEFIARTGWSAERFGAEADRARALLRARLELDREPGSRVPRGTDGGER